MTSTNINIRITDTRAEPVRKRVSIPQSDRATHEWWNAQDDPSTSVRLLILEEMRANGPVDRVTRTAVPQTPKSPSTTVPLHLSEDQIAGLNEEMKAFYATVAPILPFMSMFAAAKTD